MKPGGCGCEGFGGRKSGGDLAGQAALRRHASKRRTMMVD